MRPRRQPRRDPVRAPLTASATGAAAPAEVDVAAAWVGPSATSVRPSSVVLCNFSAASAASSRDLKAKVARPVNEPSGFNSRVAGIPFLPPKMTLAACRETLLRVTSSGRLWSVTTLPDDGVASALAARLFATRAAMRSCRWATASSCNRSRAIRLRPLLGLALLALALLLVAPLGGQAPRLGGQAPRLGVLGVALRLGQPLLLEALGPRLPLDLPARGLGLRGLGAALIGGLGLGPRDCRTRRLLLGAALVLRFLRGAARGEALRRLLGHDALQRGR